MANEIKINNQFTVTTAKGVKVTTNHSGTYDQTGTNISHHTQSVPATEEKLEIGLEGVTMANEGFIYVKNLGGTNTTATEYVTLGANGSCSAGGHTDQATCENDSKTWTAGAHTMKIIVGESVVFRAGISVLSVKASTNPTQIEVISVEN